MPSPTLPMMPSLERSQKRPETAEIAKIRKFLHSIIPNKAMYGNKVGQTPIGLDSPVPKQDKTIPIKEDIGKDLIAFPIPLDDDREPRPRRLLMFKSSKELPFFEF